MRSPTSVSFVLRSIIFVSLRSVEPGFWSGLSFGCGMLDGLPDTQEVLSAHAPDLGIRPPSCAQLRPEGGKARRVLEARGDLDQSVVVAAQGDRREPTDPRDRLGLVG